MPTIGSALTIFHEGGSPEMATIDGVSTGSPGASYQRLGICAVSSTNNSTIRGSPRVNEVREERERKTSSARNKY